MNFEEAFAHYQAHTATAEETAANVRRIWRAHGPWSVRLEPEGA